MAATLARLRKPVPSYRLHTPSGPAFSDFTDPVTGVRRSVCLGPWDSPESRAEHARRCLELSTGRVSPPPSGVTVAELLLAFLRHAEQHYRRADGTPTDEMANVKQMVRVVRESHGHLPAGEFVPTALWAVRQRMIDRGWGRRNVNLHVGRVRRVFKCGVEHELVPAAVWQALRAVGGLQAGLQAGRTAAREPAAIRPVADELVDRSLPLLSRPVGGLVRFQRLTGCRPGEACALRRGDLDMSGAVWVYRPPQHKTKHRGRERVIRIGPHAQALLAEFPTDSPEEYVFSPQKELAERNARRAAERTTRYFVSRQGWLQRKAAPKWRRRPRDTNKSYGHAIRKACKKIGLPAWAPNQLRHAFGTVVRREFGLEAAQAGPGHALAASRSAYTWVTSARAVEVAAKIGWRGGVERVTGPRAGAGRRERPRTRFRFRPADRRPAGRRGGPTDRVAAEQCGTARPGR